MTLHPFASIPCNVVRGSKHTFFQSGHGTPAPWAPKRAYLRPLCPSVSPKCTILPPRVLLSLSGVPFDFELQTFKP